MEFTFAWVMILLMGVFHGINPGMGWLFAVGLGLQEQRRSAVWAALLPLAAGHALAIAVALFVLTLAGSWIPTNVLKWSVSAMLLAFGVFRLVSRRHPRYGGMQVGARDLTIWSFLMASAHGAGLMVLPFFLGAESPAALHGAHDHATAYGHHVTAESAPIEAAHVGHVEALSAMLPHEPLVGILATLIHTIGYLLIMGLAAIVVYEKLGLRLLRTAWINLDVVWAAALIVTALLTPLV